MIAVVDTSALVELFTVEAPELDASLAERLGHVIPHVPDIIDVEFHHALRGLALGNKISSSRAEQARVLFADTPKIRFPSCELMQRSGRFGTTSAPTTPVSSPSPSPLRSL